MTTRARHDRYDHLKRMLLSIRNAMLGRTEAAPQHRGWTAWITRVAVVAPLPYSLSRLLWAIGIPVGIDRYALRHDLQSPGWGSLGMLLLILTTEGTGLFTHVFVASRARTFPGWTPYLGGRPIKPWCVIAPLLLPIWILANFNYWSIEYIIDGFTTPSEVAKTLPAWSFWMQVLIFWVWGLTLAVATGLYWRDMHRRTDRIRTPIAARRQDQEKAHPVNNRG